MSRIPDGKSERMSEGIALPDGSIKRQVPPRPKPMGRTIGRGNVTTLGYSPSTGEKIKETLIYFVSLCLLGGLLWVHFTIGIPKELLAGVLAFAALVILPLWIIWGN